MGVHIKYPRTPHLPWSPGLKNDDTLVERLFADNTEVVVTEKMDGENTSMYRDGIHARSLDGRNHISRNWVKALHGQIKHTIPEGWRICGENLYATHSIHYENLPSYFMVFSVWDADNNCLSWEDTEKFCKHRNLVTVPVIEPRCYWGDVRYHCMTAQLRPNQEGYVVRVADSFGYNEFRNKVAKYVRKDHIQTDEHWMNKPVVPNTLKEN